MPWSKPLINPLPAAVDLAFAVVALVFLLYGLYLAKMTAMRRGRVTLANQTSIWPPWVEPLFYIALGLEPVIKFVHRF